LQRLHIVGCVADRDGNFSSAAVGADVRGPLRRVGRRCEPVV
jgi:hypothetical protein